jgi:solute carrier family 40 (iron-regulated transporter), member 1
VPCLNLHHECRGMPGAEPSMASQASADDEHASLLISSVVPDENSGSSLRDESQVNHVPARVANRLYISHFLSTWNSRVFEFGAVLYLASIFPGTLLPMSVYALTRGVSAILFSPAIGQYIDIGNRLQVVRLSIGEPSPPLQFYIPLIRNFAKIVLQRLAVAGSCIIFYILAIGLPLAPSSKTGLLVLLVPLACVEKLSATMNLVSVERDWVG